MFTEMLSVQENDPRDIQPEHDIDMALEEGLIIQEEPPAQEQAPR